MASNPASITSPIHNCVLFLLWLHPFILSEVISPLISSSILGTYRPGEFIFQCPIFLPFHTVHGILKANTEVVCHSLLWWTAFCQTSPPRPGRLGWPHTAWLSFIELDKAVVMEGIKHSLCKEILSLCFFCFFLVVLHSIQDLSSLAKDQTCAPAVETQSFNHWTARAVPILAYWLHKRLECVSSRLLWCGT